MFYVNVYEVDRRYGGPEEGGWWYDTGTAIRSHPCYRLDLAEQLCNTLRERYAAQEARDGVRDVGSVLYEGGHHSVLIEREPARSYPDRRPRYE